MKLGRTIVETGKLTGLKVHQSYYHAYSHEESSFGVLRSTMLVVIPMDTLTRADDEVPHHVRSILGNFESLQGREPRSRLRKALELSRSRGLTSDESRFTAIVFYDDGTIISSNSSSALLRIRGKHRDLLPLKSGKIHHWKAGDTFLVAPPDFFTHLSTDDSASLCAALPTRAIPNALLKATGWRRPVSLVSLRILPPIAPWRQPALFVPMLSALFVLVFYLLIWPKLA